MKHYLFVAALCGVGIMASAQEIPTSASIPASVTGVNPVPPAYNAATKVNFIRIWEASRPYSLAADVTHSSRTIQEVKQVTQYVDGLGRLVQSVSKQRSPSGKDLVEPVIYDKYGREVYQYLPYVAIDSNTGTGTFKRNPFNEQVSFLSNTTYNPGLAGEQVYYSKDVYETSPLGKVDTAFSPGNSWGGSHKGKVSQSLFNTVADSVRIWTISTDMLATPVTSSKYPAGRLYKSVSIDEDGKQVIEYKDMEGKLLLKKVQGRADPSADHSGWLCTYYVYDDFDDLRCIIQPLGVGNMASTGTWVLNSTWLNELCFRYEYDNTNRMILKKVPGAGVVYMVYDNRDRLVMTQDSMLRAAGKWMYMKYDGLNRQVLSGLWANGSDRAYHQGQAGSSGNYPVPSSGYEVLTETYYDSYSWVAGSGSGLSSTFIGTYASNTDYFFAASNSVFPYPQNITPDYRTIGRVTGTKTKILGTGSYLFTTTFYDDRGRVIQEHSTNHSGGKDTVTMQYSFSGQLLRSLLCHAKAGTNAQAYKVLTKNEYDAAGRLVKVSKKTGNSPETVIAENSHDESGQLAKKKLGRLRNYTDPGTYTANAIDSLVYTYNIQGSLKGINLAYVNGSNNNHFFGQALSYDYGFTQAYLNGNIAGIKWRNKSDGEQRAYGFAYDPANRFAGADFTQYTSGTWNKTAGIDYSVTNMSYDANGNIVTMTQRGLKGTASQIIDSLEYAYLTGSNRLLSVTDKTNDLTTALGDFREIDNNPSQDYTYNGNGNPVTDNNRGIRAIRYNHLNLPDSIHVFGKGIIRYVYHAGGMKLSKVTIDSTTAPVRTTTYMYVTGFEYRNDTLQLVAHEEGRVRPKRSNYSDTMYYDYFEKDHLGNVRAVITDEWKQDIYPALTLEGSVTNPASAAYIENQYYNIDTTRIVDKSEAALLPDYQNNNGNPPYNPNPNSNTTADSDKLFKLAGVPNHGPPGPQGRTGLGITLKVMAGDKIDIFGLSYYTTPTENTNNYPIPLSHIFDGIMNAPTGAALGKGFTAGDLAANANLVTLLTDFLNDPARDNSVSTNPLAFINWILLDETFNYVDGGFSPVGAKRELKQHYDDASMQAISMAKSGYIYVFASNSSLEDVFFDNLQVAHTRGPLVSTTDYYPFGLTMKGISSNPLGFGDPQNKKGYSGNELQTKEFADGHGLELYDFNARTYDQQIGRFMQIDPLSDEEGQESWTPFHNSYNNTPRFVDPNGKLPIIPAVIIVIGLLTASKPAIAPTGRPGEAKAIQQSYNNYNNEIFMSLIPGGRAAKPSQILYQKAANTIKKKVAEEAKKELQELVIDGNKHPEAAKHAKEAIDNGVSPEGVVDRKGASARRRESTKDTKTEANKDRDEFPPAVLKTNQKVSVKLINQSDNRGAGASLGHQLKNIPDNTKVVIRVIEPRKPKSL